mmetsp:Transcript_11355/g.32117  ORF Transcript_11355/g.32117 Transcript_11355/m.32117 type:complete len:373 (-) Transcript_11355:1429-2547(-)
MLGPSDREEKGIVVTHLLIEHHGAVDHAVFTLGRHRADSTDHVREITLQPRVLVGLVRVILLHVHSDKRAALLVVPAVGIASVGNPYVVDLLLQTEPGFELELAADGSLDATRVEVLGNLLPMRPTTDGGDGGRIVNTGALGVKSTATGMHPVSKIAVGVDIAISNEIMAIAIGEGRDIDGDSVVGPGGTLGIGGRLDDLSSVGWPDLVAINVEKLEGVTRSIAIVVGLWQGRGERCREDSVLVVMVIVPLVELLLPASVLLLVPAPIHLHVAIEVDKATGVVVVNRAELDVLGLEDIREVVDRTEASVGAVRVVQVGVLGAGSIGKLRHVFLVGDEDSEAAGIVRGRIQTTIEVVHNNVIHQGNLGGLAVV